MAGLSLRHIYKVYPGKKNNAKATFQKIFKKKSDENAVAKRTGDFMAVKDFSMEIEDGEFIVFVGPSGCGKSTTIRMIAGLEDITDGELYIDGQLVNDIPAKDRDIAMVFQNYALYPHMTVRKNIEFALKLRKIPVEKKDKDGNPVLAIDKKKIRQINEKLKIFNAEIPKVTDEEYKQKLLADKELLEQALAYYTVTPVQVVEYKHMPKSEINEKVMWAAKILGIEELLDIKPAEMSGGQRQRVALGRAMVRGPKVFLLDEPLSNLDAKLRASMRLEIVKLHNELKTTFIYVTHDQIEAMTMGTRIVVMKLGVVQQIDTPTNLYDYPENKFVAGFIGTPQMNFFDVSIKKVDDSIETTFADGQVVNFKLSKLRTIDKAYLDGQPHNVTLGIRGEHIALNSKTSKAADGALETTLVVKEVLGNTTQMFIKLGDNGSEYIVSVPDRNNYVSGDKLSVSLKEKHVHMFDAESELSIMGREYGNK